MKPGRVLALAVVLAGLAAVAGTPGAQADPDRQAKLNQLTKQSKALSKAYRGEIQSLEEAKRAARKADARAKSLKSSVASAETSLTMYAQTSYMNGGLDPTQMFTFGNGDLNQAAKLNYLATERAARLNRLAALLKEAKQAEKAADDKIDELEDNIEELRKKRRQVERLLARFGFQTPDAGTGLTPRMISIRNQIMQNFPMPYGVGCLRRGDPGEHGVGRACDFMMSPGGRPAAGDDLERGNALAEWCIKNGRQIGIMYIIWQQRYYDIRTGGGWRMMADRGSPTANHYDHVHVSVL
ncbi:hypothetical protein AB0K60_09600 [Thermopolyspora sp. NPDC052614]|uniref:coiled-coil domain-containing protein n=1 Tax=Thermopolyspora sp. NPDC052614 TaxID=3155682 RepID=UPI0034155EF4